MIAAIGELTVNEGVDPRDSTLVAGGGAAGLDDRCRSRGELGCREVLIPRAAGVLSRLRRSALRHRRARSPRRT